MQHEAILERLKSMSDPDGIARMARYAINSEHIYGIPIPALRKIARELGRDHVLAQELWSSGIHDARNVACLIDDPSLVTEAQMEAWALDFDSWAIVDNCCGNLLDRTPFAHAKAVEWSYRPQEYVKRAGFALMATLSVHGKTAPDDALLKFLPAIVRESTDDRNFVMKAVNWALRQIGKRNLLLNEAAIGTAREIRLIGSKSARWIASDALRELTSAGVQERLRRLKSKHL